MKVDHIGVSVADLDRSLDWYEKVLGFTPGYRFEEPGKGLRGAFAIAPDGVRIELLERTGSQPARDHTNPFRAAEFHGYHHVCLAVDDLDDTYRRLVSQGATEVWEPHQSPQPGVRVGYVADLDGNFIELLETDPEVEVER
jgi:catechol 2,3-dioxygenase-like lactoylglutathione lyase family enzyme